MKKICLVVVCLLSTLPLVAQVHLSAQTDKTDLALDDELTLTVQVSGVSGNIVMPQLPSLPAFNVYSREMAQSTVNGHTTLSFRYLMIPRFVGRTTIGPVTFSYGGKTYQTDPIDIRIYKSATVAASQSKSSNRPATRQTTAAAADISQLPPLEKELSTRAYAHENEPYFMISAISNKKPYPGQPFTLGVRFYYAPAFYEAAYHNPQVSNLFMEEGPSVQGRQNINGTMYNYEEKRYELSGVSAGKASIGAAMVDYRTASAGNSLFDRFFGGAVVSKPVTVASKPITLNILPLPAGKPASFYGAVGTDYTLTTRLDKPRTEAGEAVTLTVTVQGPGSLKTTSDLKFPEIPGLTSYPAAPETGFVSNNSSRGYKTFKTVLVPASSGQYMIEGINWSYLDPNTSTYKTLSARPLTLEVFPATHAAKQLDFGTSSPVGNGIQTIRQDIEYVKGTYDTDLSLLQRIAAWKWMHALVFTWLAVCLFMACIGKKTAAKKHAYQYAKTQLKQARTYEHISDALADYLRLKWNISAASLPLKGMITALAQHGVPPETQQTFATLWTELESARFAPLSKDTNTLAQLSARAENLLKQWENSK